MIKTNQKSLVILFLTEMYERYGFYVTQALLIFYLIQKLHLSDAQSYSIVGAYTAFAYINGIIGGIIADKLIGYDRTVTLGALLLTIGYYICFAHLNNFTIFILGLAFVASGTGNLKPNIPSLISIIYTQQQEKETAYNIFYIGLYIGALSGSLLGGYLQQHYGWTTAFSSPFIAIILGLLCFYIGKTCYKIKDNRKFNINILLVVKLIIIELSIILISFYNLINSAISNYIFMISVVVSICYMLFLIVTVSAQQQKSLLLFFYLIIFSCIYWAINFQQFFSISLASTRIFHGPMPYTILTCFVSLGIIIFGPILTYLWHKLGSKNPSIITKFSISFLLNTVVFLLLAIAAHYSNTFFIFRHQIIIVIAYLLIAIGELCISPVGLFMVSELVPKDAVGVMMGFYMLSIGIGGKLAGFFAQIANISDPNNMIAMQHIYCNAFLSYAAISMIMFLMVMILRKLN
jgi:POT family proton-dependent oligopeptide transporter